MRKKELEEQLERKEALLAEVIPKYLDLYSLQKNLTGFIKGKPYCRKIKKDSSVEEEYYIDIEFYPCFGYAVTIRMKTDTKEEWDSYRIHDLIEFDGTDARITDRWKNKRENFWTTFD